MAFLGNNLAISDNEWFPKIFQDWLDWLTGTAINNDALT